MESSQERFNNVSAMIDDMTTVKELVPQEKHLMLREALKEQGRTIYEDGKISVRIMWCPTPEDSRMNAWLLAISAPVGTKVRFGDLQIGDRVIITPRIPMDMLWIRPFTLVRGEWFEPIFNVPSPTTPVIFDLSFDDVSVVLRF